MNQSNRKQNLKRLRSSFVTSKNIIFALIAVVILTALPVYAQKWDNFGLDAGIYIDTDTITDFGSTMSFSYKFENDFILEKLSDSYGIKDGLSVCYMRANVSCPSGKKLSSNLQCYDNSGNLLIDKDLTYDNNTQEDRTICKNLKKMKKFRKLNLI